MTVVTSISIELISNLVLFRFSMSMDELLACFGTTYIIGCVNFSWKIF